MFYQALTLFFLISAYRRPALIRVLAMEDFDFDFK